MNVLRKIFDYIKPSWEGDDGKFSYRRISQLIFILLIFKITMLGMTQTQWGFYTLLTLCITFLLLAAIISADQIIKALHGISGLRSLTSVSQEEIVDDTTKTIKTEVKQETEVKKDVPASEEGG